MPWDIEKDFAWPTAAAILKVRQEVLASAGLVPGTREYEDAMDQLSENDTSRFEADEPVRADHVGGYRTAAVPALDAPWARGHWYGDRLQWVASIVQIVIFLILLVFVDPARRTPFMLTTIIALVMGCAVFPRVAVAYAWCAVDESGKKLRTKVADKLIQVFNWTFLLIFWCREAFGYGNYGTVGRCIVAFICLPSAVYVISSGIRDLMEEHKRHMVHRLKPATGFFAR